MNTKKQNDIDNALRVLGANGYLLRDEILDILLRDETIHELLGGSYNENYEHLYWDDGDLVSTHYKNETIASIGYSYIKNKSDQNQTIGDMKKDIMEFCAKQKREIEINNNEIDNIIETLEEISELISVDIFDMNWKNDEREDEDKQDFALYSIWRAIDVLKKERK